MGFPQGLPTGRDINNITGYLFMSSKNFINNLKFRNYRGIKLLVLTTKQGNRKV